MGHKSKKTKVLSNEGQVESAFDHLLDKMEALGEAAYNDSKAEEGVGNAASATDAIKFYGSLIAEIQEKFDFFKLRAGIAYFEEGEVGKPGKMRNGVVEDLV